jgi:flagellar hook assembly protein FlgD
MGGEARDQQTIFDSFDTVWQMGVSIVDASVRVPGVVLERVRPNPVRGAATVTYALPKPADVDLALVDVQGRRVATLIHGKQPAGRHIVSWDERQNEGRAVPAGIYFVQLRAGAETRTERVTLLH